MQNHPPHCEPLPFNVASHFKDGILSSFYPHGLVQILYGTNGISKNMKYFVRKQWEKESSRINRFWQMIEFILISISTSPLPSNFCWTLTMSVRAKLLQSCLTLWPYVNCSPLGSSVPGILQARILEWVAIPLSRGSSWPRDWNQISYICIGRQVLNH